MNFARLIQPYNSQLSAAYSNAAVAAYTAAGSGATFQDKLYYNIQYYLLTGDTTASNYIRSYYNNQTYYFTNTYRYEASGFVVNNGQIWLASYFMSYIIATNRPTDPNIVAYFKSILQQAADNEVGFVNGDAYPVGWPTNANPYTQDNYTKGPFTSQGEFAYPCLMEWALTGTQKYIDAVSQLMDYDQGLNPLGKCYMSGMGFNRIHNPHMIESDYAQRIRDWAALNRGLLSMGRAPPNRLRAKIRTPLRRSLMPIFCRANACGWMTWGTINGVSLPIIRANPGRRPFTRCWRKATRGVPPTANRT